MERTEPDRLIYVNEPEAEVIQPALVDTLTVIMKIISKLSEECIVLPLLIIYCTAWQLSCAGYVNFNLGTKCLHTTHCNCIASVVLYELRHYNELEMYCVCILCVNNHEHNNNLIFFISTLKTCSSWAGLKDSRGILWGEEAPKQRIEMCPLTIQDTVGGLLASNSFS